MAGKKAVRRVAPATGSRRELDRETKKILRLKDEIAKNFWDLGASLVRVNDGDLFRAARYRSFHEYLKQAVKIGRSTAYRLMELSRHFSRETASKFGQEKLLGAIAYAKATPEPDRPFDVTRYTIEVKTANGEKIEKDFKQASSKEIKRAAALLRRKVKTQETPSVLQVPALSGLLSGKTPKFRIAPFLSKAREKLNAFSPRPTLALTVTKKGEDPLVDLHLSKVHASKLTQVFGLLAAAALEVWMDSIK